MDNARRLTAGRGPRIQISFDGTNIDCYEGETVATALLAAGIDRFRTTTDETPRQPLCNMGTCFDCAVVIDGKRLTRSCLTPARQGMLVQPERGY